MNLEIEMSTRKKYLNLRVHGPYQNTQEEL